MPFEEITRSILELDETVLTLDNLIALQSMLPTDDERKAISAYRGDIAALSRPEQFLSHLSGTSLLEMRVEFFLFKLRAPGDLKEIKENIEYISQACTELRNSDKFAQILKLILALGTVLNQGTYLSSNGFKLDSLLKLAETKAKNNQLTLLQYLASIVKAKTPELLDFVDEIPCVEYAAQIPLDVLVPELRDISSSMEKLAGALQSFSDSEKQADSFYQIMNTFYQSFKPAVEEATTLLTATLESFTTTALYFGEENQNEKHTKQFFSIIDHFSRSFEKAVKEVAIEKRQKTVEKSR